LKNFDFRVVPTSWAQFRCLDGYNHFALVNHDQQGINSGLNQKGLALVISSSDIGTEREEKRTILNAEILSQYDNVADAVVRIKEYAIANPDMRGGNVILADYSKIAIVEYFEGKTEADIIAESYLARANHSVFGLVDNASENSTKRHESMSSFLQHLFLDAFPSEAEIIQRCKNRLRREPILNHNTRGSFVISVHNQRVDYKVEDQGWMIRHCRCNW
jgi:hypothetical protein